MRPFIGSVVLLSLSAACDGSGDGLDIAGRDAGTPAAADAARADAATWTAQPERITLGVVPNRQPSTWSLTVQVDGRGLELDALTIEAVDAAGWTIVAEANIERVEPGESFVVQGTAESRQSIDLEASIVMTHPDATEPLRVPITGETVRAPTVLYDPEDIGFGAIEVGSAAAITVFFSSSVEVGMLPGGLMALPVDPEPEWMSGFIIRYQPTAERPIESATLTSDGRRIPITGRGVRSALRILTNPIVLRDQSLAACRTVDLELGNTGLGTTSAVPLVLQVDGPARAEWVRPPAFTALGPLEAQTLTAEVCATGPGPFELSVHGESSGSGSDALATVAGRAGGPALRTEGPIRIDDLIVGLPRRVTTSLTNDGPQTLVVESAEVVGLAGGTIDLLGPPLAVTLDGGRRLSMPFELTPSASGQATIRLSTNQLDRPTVDIDVEWMATPQPCRFEVLTPSLDYGTYNNQGAPAAFVMRNTGTTPCAVLIPAVLPSPFDWTGPARGQPWDSLRRRIELEAGARSVLPIELAAIVPGSYREQATLWIAQGAAPAAEETVPSERRLCSRWPSGRAGDRSSVRHRRR